MNKKIAITIVLLLIIAIASSYSYTLTRQPTRLHITTTTSLYATGLLDYLSDNYEKVNPRVEASFIAVGSGAALKMADKGDACMVFVHAPSLEKQYIEKGTLKDHYIIAYNYFVIVGPPDDPAGVSKAHNASEAFSSIYKAGDEGKTLFISRGDNSGTNVKELSIWKAAGLNPEGKNWYLESGQGMGQTLVMADEKRAYTLSDIGTFLKYKKDGTIKTLKVLYTNDTELINIYSMYIVTTCKGKELDAAKGFYNYVKTHLDLIGSYGIDKYGQPLFYSAQGKEQELYSIWEELANQ
ncbi:MAG: substrate-binding domain-containing protein [Desulfurococcales archaeon]|nr:substrate-binding domain-containing protein [Desulfurococcales archaeon]